MHVAQHSGAGSSTRSVKRRQGRGGCTPAQDEMIAFIAGQIALGRIPSTANIRDHMGWKNNHSVGNCLDRIAARGMIPPGFPYKKRVW